jgi:hypothetical protein
MQIESEINLTQFDTLVSLLAELQKRFMSGTAASAAFILVCIVWFASAKDSAPFLKQFPHFLWLVALAPVLGAMLYSYCAWLVYKRSQKIATGLDRLCVMPSELYESSVVSRGQFFVFSAGVVLLSMILGGCIYCAGKSAADEEDTNEDETIMQVSLRHASETPIAGHVATDFACSRHRT